MYESLILFNKYVFYFSIVALRDFINILVSVNIGLSVLE